MNNLQQARWYRDGSDLVLKNDFYEIARIAVEVDVFANTTDIGYYLSLKFHTGTVRAYGINDVEKAMLEANTYLVQLCKFTNEWKDRLNTVNDALGIAMNLLIDTTDKGGHDERR